MRTFSIHWKKLSLLTRSLLILFLLNGVIASILLFPLAGDLRYTSLAYAGGYVVFHFDLVSVGSVGADSWWSMYKAIEHLREFPEVPLYSKIFFDEHIKFIYPPSSLLIIELIQKIPGMSWWKMVKLLNNLSWFCVLFIGILTSTLLYKNSRDRFGKESFSNSRTDILALYSVVLLITLTFYPITRSFRVGQIQTEITLLLAASLLAWQYDRKKIAGFLIGLICTIKPQWGFLLLWGWLRRQWGMAIVGTITAFGLVGISVCMYGFHYYIDYMSVLSFISKHGESFYPNQSMNGLMNRFLFNGNNLVWVGDSYPPFNPVVYGSTLISSFLIIGTALIWRCRSIASVKITELAIIMLSITIATPIAWEHHYGVLLPIFAVVGPISLSKRVFGKWTAVYLISAFFLASQRLEIINRLADTRFNILQSHLFFAGIMILFTLYIISSKPEHNKVNC